MNKKIIFSFLGCLVILIVAFLMCNNKEVGTSMMNATVISKNDEKIMLHKLKKFYTTMDKAIKLNEHHNPDNYYTIDHLLDAFTVKKICTGDDTSCAPKQYKEYRGNNSNYWGVKDREIKKANYAILAGGYLVRYTAKLVFVSVLKFNVKSPFKIRP